MNGREEMFHEWTKKVETPRLCLRQLRRIRTASPKRLSASERQSAFTVDPSMLLADHKTM
ncbi:hypothetical protein ES702_02737 [subsurface metagenome]